MWQIPLESKTLSIREQRPWTVALQWVHKRCQQPRRPVYPTSLAILSRALEWMPFHLRYVLIIANLLYLRANHRHRRVPQVKKERKWRTRSVSLELTRMTVVREMLDNSPRCCQEQQNWETSQLIVLLVSYLSTKIIPLWSFSANQQPGRMKNVGSAGISMRSGSRQSNSNDASGLI